MTPLALYWRGWRRVRLEGRVVIAAIILLALGFLTYVGAFAQGPGPSATDRPLQATMFLGATAMMITGFIILVI